MAADFSSPKPGEIQALSKQAWDAAVERVSDRLGKWLLYRRTDSPRGSRLEVFVDPQGRALATLIQRRDGTVTYRERGKGQKNNLPKDWVSLLNKHRDRLAYQLYREVMTGPGKQRLHFVDACDTQWGRSRLLEMLGPAVNRVLSQAFTECHPPSGVRAVKFHNAQRVLNNQVKLLVRPEHWEWITGFLRHAPLSEHVALRVYNMFTLHHNLFLKMRREAPEVLRFFLKYMFIPGGDWPTLHHPAQVTRLVQDTLELSPLQWRYFTRLGDGSRESGIDGLPQSGIDGLPQTKTRIQLATKAMVDANYPHAPDAALARVFALTTKHNSFNQPEMIRNGGWKAWVHIINRFLNAAADTGCEDNLTWWTTRSCLPQIGDALRGYLTDGRHWGLTDWESYQRRSDHWHQEIRQRTYTPPVDERPWTTLVPTTNIAGMVVAPVTTAANLHELGRQMGNCIASRTSACQKGTTRVFKILDGDELVAAGEICRINNTWDLGQVEGPFRSPTNQPIREAMWQTLRLYQDAYDQEMAVRTA